jgi:threonine synthase
MLTYISTRGRAGERSFEEVLLAGLAEDGGLFVPTTWPRIAADDLRRLGGALYAETATRVLAPFVAGCFDEDELGRLCADAYAGFAHPAVAPLKQIGPNHWVLELYHGPTLAFKDFAMRLLARMFDAVLARRGQRITIVGATSGDTGAAAVKAFAGKAQARVAMLHPKGRVSAVQRRQMTTETADNVLNLAVEGSFDDCQALVKAMFADEPFRRELGLTAVNSINWARVAAQAAYYVYAALRLGAPDRAVAFCVPTGNFGNIYAGWVAARLGLPIARLVVATNSNDILARFFASGTYATGEVVQTISPSMDIQVASNFERLLHASEDGDGARVGAQMRSLAQSGGFTVADEVLASMRPLLAAGSADEVQTKRTIRNTFLATGDVVDPHTAVGLAVAERQELEPGTPLVTLSTAHPAKFAEAVGEATGTEPRLPTAFADLLTRPERMTTVPNDLGAVQARIAESFAA